MKLGAAKNSESNVSEWIISSDFEDVFRGSTGFSEGEDTGETREKTLTCKEEEQEKG